MRRERPLPPEPFDAVVRRMVEELGAERALVVYGGDVTAPTPRAAHGFDHNAVWTTAPLSLTILRKVLASGEPLHSIDALEGQGFEDSASLLITGVRAVICAPLWHNDEVRGLLYADRLVRGRPFSRGDNTVIMRMARDLELTIRQHASPGADGGDESVVAPAEPPTPRSRIDVARPTPRKASAPEPPALTLPRRSRIVFLQSFATLLGVGVSLSRSLALLGEDGDDHRTKAVAYRILEGVERGQSLSRAISACGSAFTPLQLKLLEVADRTGTTDVVLRRLAMHDERSLALMLRVRSVLTYPIALCLICGVLLLLIPPLLLKGQLEAMQSAGMTPPAITQALLSVSRFMSSLPGLLVVAAVSAGGIPLALRVSGNARAKRWLRRRASAVPRLGRLLVELGTARFASALEMQLDAGVSVLDAVSASAEAAGDPLLLDGAKNALEGLRAGLDMTQSLERVAYFPSGFVSLLSAGEESGELPRLLGWIATHYEREVDGSLEMAAAALEPLVLMVLGVAAAGVCLATMLPLVKMVEQL
ncbi:MAG: GAF domain-containing protein [Proteobacteria bacterium]|nr:GAF domain-containing protein [Pseudomonadota bacterium]